MPTRPRSAFTIVELLVVMLVIGILASMALVRYRTMKARAYVGVMKNDLGQLRIAEEAFWADNQLYTVDQTLLDFRATTDVALTVTSADLNAGYDAQAVHPEAPGITCKMYVGRAVTGAPSGAVTCQ